MTHKTYLVMGIIGSIIFSFIIWFMIWKSNEIINKDGLILFIIMFIFAICGLICTIILQKKSVNTGKIK